MLMVPLKVPCRRVTVGFAKMEAAILGGKPSTHPLESITHTHAPVTKHTQICKREIDFLSRNCLHLSENGMHTFIFHADS